MKLPRKKEEILFSTVQGRCIYDLRLSREMTRREMEKLTGISQQALFRIEMGQATASAYDLRQIARALGVTIEVLSPESDSCPVVETMISVSARCRPVFA